MLRRIFAVGALRAVMFTSLKMLPDFIFAADCLLIADGADAAADDFMFAHAFTLCHLRRFVAP